MNNPEPVTIPGGKIQFYDYYLPRLQAGKYEVEVTQIIDTSETADYSSVPIQRFDKSRRFHVEAPRFRLGPADVHAVFPPGNMTGNFDQFLPHIVLRRRTIPWERALAENAPADAPVRPWLALLLFHADDNDGAGPPARRSLPLSQIINPAENDVLGPSLSLSVLDDPESNAHTIDVAGDLFNRIVPQLDELPLLSHVRQVNTGDKELLGLEEDGWFSVIICNRLPKPAQLNTAHLVTLEGWADRLDHVPPNRKARLVSLASWSFTAEPARGSFKELMEGLDIGLLRVSLPESVTQREDSAVAMVKTAVNNGYVPLNFETRLGEQTAGWYRGPLLPVRIKRDDKDPYESAEAALIYDPRTGLFDASYAVAWQIGRLLALADGPFAAALQKWRMEGHQLLDQILERLGLADRFADANIFVSLDILESTPDPEHQQQLLGQLWQDLQNPRLMSERLFNNVITDVLDNLVLTDDPAAKLMTAPVDKRELLAGLGTLTMEQIAEIATLPPGLERAEEIREKLLEGTV